MQMKTERRSMVTWVNAALAAALLFSAGCARSQPVFPFDPVPGAVPAAYREIYRELEAELSRLNPIGLPTLSEKSRTAFGVELLVANSNRGEELLNERVIQAAALTLERLKDLGVQSVSLSIQYPVLTSDHPKTEQFRAFYRRIAEEIHKRGFTTVVELGTMFREPELSRMPVDYHGLTRQRLGEGLRQMAEAVMADIHPSYLTVLSEPDTQARNTGLPFPVAEFAATVKRVVKDLPHAGTKLGAGAGTWNAVDYFKALTEIPELDYIDLHIYPILLGFADERVVKIEEIVKARRKSVTIGEAWLYKVSRREFNRIQPLEVFARDAFSFWQPLDERFVKTVEGLARSIHAEFCSFFWMKYFFGYLDYSPAMERLSAAQIMTLSDEAAAEGIEKNSLSGTGKQFRYLISP
jgi:hypothetical protein